MSQSYTPVCCGIWSGGPTASGAYPTANHTLAVDASNPFVPMGTKVVMNGVEYTVVKCYNKVVTEVANKI